MGPLTRPDVAVTCEHASRRFPTALGSLGLTAAQRRSHIAWDPGAASVARVLAAAWGRSPLLGGYSRLVADLNRSPSHPGAVPRVAFGVRVPGNASLSRAERARRIARYHAPWRQRALDMIGRVVAVGGGCVHLSVHSFTPMLHGIERRADVGLLYDPRRPRECRLVTSLRDRLIDSGFTVRRNYPYRGTADGFTTWCRRHFPPTRYLGIEIELNQRLAGRAGVKGRIVEAVTDALRAVRR